VEEAFEAKLTVISGPSNGASGSDRHDEPEAQPTNGDVVAATRAATGHALEAIDNSEIAHPELRRIRDEDHLDLFRPSGASSAAAHLPIPIICALRKAARWDVRSATNGSSHSVEAIIARFIATVTSATGGKNPGLTQTLPHEVCGYSLIPCVRFS
jgi:hypothetical protein